MNAVNQYIAGLRGEYSDSTIVESGERQASTSVVELSDIPT